MTVLSVLFVDVPEELLDEREASLEDMLGVGLDVDSERADDSFLLAEVGVFTFLESFLDLRVGYIFAETTPDIEVNSNDVTHVVKDNLFDLVEVVASGPNDFVVEVEKGMLVLPLSLLVQSFSAPETLTSLLAEIFPRHFGKTVGAVFYGEEDNCLEFRSP